MNINNNFKLEEVDSDKIYSFLKQANASKAPGIDKLSGVFIKDGAEVLAKPLSQLINLFIISSTFPDPCGIAKLKALYRVFHKKRVLTKQLSQMYF